MVFVLGSQRFTRTEVRNNIIVFESIYLIDLMGVLRGTQEYLSYGERKTGHCPG